MRRPREVGESDGVSPDSWLRVLVGFGIPFLLIFTLAVEAGGYEVIFRSQLGIIVWWALLLGLLGGLLPLARVTRVGWSAVAVFGGLVLMTALATLFWTESAERGVIEVSRILVIFGAFLLLLLTQGRDGLKLSLGALGAATALVAVIALVDRFDPGLLPFGSSQLLPENYPRARLNFPLEYWNGLAAMMAIGTAPLLWLAYSVREPFLRALAGGVIPLVALTAYMTASRGGAAAATGAMLVLLLLSPERLRLALNSLVPALGSLALVALVNRRPEIRDLVSGDAASSQGIEMVWICLAVVFAVSGVQYLLNVLLDRGSIRVPQVDRRTTRLVGSGAGLLVLLVVLTGIFSGFFTDRWNEFKEPSTEATVSRLSTINSSERYLVWDSAFDAAASEKLTGIGPGTFEYWWAREGTGIQFVRDAHSLYFEALAEMGPLAFLLVLLLIFGPIAFSVRLAVRLGSDPRRAPLAAAAGGMVAFAIAAGVDWAWELTVLPVAFFALVAAVLGPEIASDRAASSPPGAGRISRLPVRIAAAVGALVAIAVITVPMLGTQALESSQEQVRAGNLGEALSEAETAVDLQPWAASPRIQQAQVLDLLGRQRQAIDAAQEAIDREGQNWRNWLVLSQILEKSSPRKSAFALLFAQELNSKSTLPELGAPGLEGD